MPTLSPAPSVRLPCRPISFGRQLATMPVRARYRLALTVLAFFTSYTGHAFAGALEDGETAAMSGECAKAVVLLRPFADNGLAAAQTHMGDCYEGGIGFPHDSVEAAKWYRKAAYQGIAEAQYALGILLLGREGVTEDYAEAAFWLGRAATQGEPAAQAALGGLYVLGDGVPEDYTKAANWLLKAALQGIASAQEQLGRLYVRGDGTTQDVTMGLFWFRRAANQGDTSAQTDLALAYELGIGIKQDFIKAHMWYNLAGAADRGYASDNAVAGKARAARDRLEIKMTPEQIAEAQKRARDWTPRSCGLDGNGVYPECHAPGVSDLEH